MFKIRQWPASLRSELYLQHEGVKILLAHMYIKYTSKHKGRNFLCDFKDKCEYALTWIWSYTSVIWHVPHRCHKKAFTSHSLADMQTNKALMFSIKVIKYVNEHQTETEQFRWRSNSSLLWRVWSQVYGKFMVWDTFFHCKTQAGVS